MPAIQHQGNTNISSPKVPQANVAETKHEPKLIEKEKDRKLKAALSKTT